MGFSGGAGVAPFLEGSALAPPLTSGNAGGRLWRAHAGWVGAHLCHLCNLWFHLLHLKTMARRLPIIVFPYCCCCACWASPGPARVIMTSAWTAMAMAPKTDPFTGAASWASRPQHRRT